MNPSNVIIAGLIIMICGGVLATTEDPNPDDEYCDMVDLYKSSNGENGWVAYKGEEVCTKN
jgi:hypothetical protein